MSNSLSITIGMTILVASSLGGCGQPNPETETDMNNAETIFQPPADRSSEADLKQSISVYLAAWSAQYRQQCRLQPRDDHTARQLYVQGMAAARTLEQSPDQSVVAIESRLLREEFEPSDGGEPSAGVVLQMLLARMGEMGLKSYLRLQPRHTPEGLLYFQIDGPALDAPDDRWLAFARESGRGHFPAELLWLLTGDRQALADLREEPDYYVDARTSADWIPGDSIVRDVLLIGGPGGVAEEVLTEWAQAPRCRALRWAALLALGQRSGRAAREQLRAIVEERFPIDEHDLIAQPGTRVDAGDPEEFQFVLEYAAVNDPDRWPLIEGLIADSHPDLLAARSAALIAIGENWTAPDCPQGQLRDVVANTYYEEENAWLRGLMVEFLATHPNPLE